MIRIYTLEDRSWLAVVYDNDGLILEYACADEKNKVCIALIAKLSKRLLNIRDYMDKSLNPIRPTKLFSNMSTVNEYNI